MGSGLPLDSVVPSQPSMPTLPSFGMDSFLQAGLQNDPSIEGDNLIKRIM